MRDNFCSYCKKKTNNQCDWNLSNYRVTLPGGKKVLLTRQTVQIKENEMILPRKKKRKKGTGKNRQIEEEKKRRYETIIIPLSGVSLSARHLAN